MTTREWLDYATTALQTAGIGSARLDAEIILAHTLRKPRTWLHAHDEVMLDSRMLDIVGARLDLRLDRVPIAYIVGHKEFFGRRFNVTTETLIPRPESEALIELFLELSLQAGARLIDVGTGSGCLGITAKLEHPSLLVALADINPHALTVAEKNAIYHHVDVEIIRSDLLSTVPYIATVIIANLPYVDATWDRSPETDHEPGLALFAPDNGLFLINKLIDQTEAKLIKGGWLLLEADLRQHHAIIYYAEQKGFRHIKSQGLAILLHRP